jgi:hypothetical protein
MPAVRFKVTSTWPILRAIEYAHCGGLGLCEAETALLKSFSGKCSIAHDTRFVTVSDVVVGELDAAMKALTLIARSSERLVGRENAARCTANAMSTRQKILSIRTRLDLTGGVSEQY